MKLLTTYFLISLMLLAGTNVFAQNQKVVLNDSVFQNFYELRLSSSTLWVYNSGNANESSLLIESNEKWQPIDITLPKGGTHNDWNGAGWFKAILKIDRTLFGKKMAIRGFSRGAFKLFVNSELVGTGGQVGVNKTTEEAAGLFSPIEFNFSNNPEQTITIAYSNYSCERFFNKEMSGLHLFIGYPEKVKTAYDVINNRRDNEQKRFHLIFGFMVAMGLLHLFLFIFYPVEKANLTCALFFFSISGIFLSGIIFDSTSSADQYIYYIFGEGLAITMTSIILPFFIYQLINRKYDWLPFLLLLVGLSVLIMVIINPVANKFYYYTFFFLTLAIGIIIIIYARFKQKMQALNIILGFYIIAFILLLPSLLEISFGLKILWYNNIMLMNLSAIPVSIGYSFYLARGVAMTNKQLHEQLKENEQLSNEKLKSESEKKQIIENQKKNLEKEVKQQTAELRKSLKDLKSAQSQLIQSEKMASLGELTAGIAHEIQNPLNFVNNFSEVSTELLLELRTELENGNLEDVKELVQYVIDNLEKINHHGKRADTIIKGMLEHSRTNTGEKKLTNINTLIDEFVRLSYHGLKAKDKTFNADFKLDLDPDLPEINVVAPEIGRVILNLVNNAFFAVNEKAKVAAEGYNPEIKIQSKTTKTGIQLSIDDNGDGIPKNILDKIFQPFFTTKPTGQGTGLGLSLSYDIIKAHGGTLNVESEEGKGTRFAVNLPVNS